MRRFASIDFLRGLAIVMMLVLHVIMFVIDRNEITYLSTLPALDLIAFMAIVFAGGLAGFFLLTSAIGNMISMCRNYQSGKSVNDVAIKQIVGGMILMVFAVLTEGTLGYNGALGEILRLQYNDWTMILWRGYNFETIHTIAWCMIINGFVQWLLSKQEGWKKIRRNVLIYIVLVVAVVALTPVMWSFASWVVPGYPYTIGGTYGENAIPVQYPLPGGASFGQYIYLFLLAPLAGSDEPIFPYLAVSFIGSIIGILMSMDKDKVPRDFPRKMMFTGLIMFLVGLIGIVMGLITMLNNPTLYPNTLTDLVMFYDHRWWSNIGLLPGTPPHCPEGMWLFQFLMFNGASLCLTMIIIRLVEFRGKGQKFGQNTLIIRRYGFTAFSIYNYQFVYFLPWFLVCLLFNVPGYGGDGNLWWYGVALTLLLSFLLFELILRLWQRRDFVLGFEWCIGLIASKILPVKKQAAASQDGKDHWWQAGRLDVKNSLLAPEFINIVEADELQHENQVEAKLAWKLAFWGLLFFPLSIASYRIANGAIVTEPNNSYSRKAKIMAIISFGFTVAWVTFLSFVSLTVLGIPI